MRHVVRLLLGCVLCTGTVAGALRAAEERDVDPDEAMLRRAGVVTTDDGLLAFLRMRSGADADLKDIDKLIRQLGSKEFPEREEATRRLSALGPAALKELRRHLTD